MPQTQNASAAQCDAKGSKQSRVDLRLVFSGGVEDDVQAARGDGTRPLNYALSIECEGFPKDSSRSASAEEALTCFSIVFTIDILACICAMHSTQI